MKEMLSVNFELKAFRYVSEKEMKDHIEAMTKEGWTRERSGKYLLKPSSSTEDFCNKDNWIYTAEFSKSIEKVTADEPTSYETELYWFNIYKSEGDMQMKRKPLENPEFTGCLNCGSVPLQILDDNKMFFPGGVHMLSLTIDKRCYSIDQEDGIKLSEIEENYKEQLNKCKFAELGHMTPLHDETWEYNIEDKKWYLVEQGMGYA